MSISDGESFPNPSTVSASDLGLVLRDLAGLANELAAPLVSEELRLAQYRRVANVAEWVTKAADSLHYCLDRQANPDESGEDD